MSATEVVMFVAFGVFWIAEAVCHFLLRNAPGSETLSHITRRVAQTLTGRWWHLLVAMPPILLFLDFEGWL